MSKSKIVSVAESMPIGLVLALVGGFMDAYTYINHGNVFATGQTGNLVLIGIRFAAKNYYGAMLAFVPIIFFILGVFSYEHLKNRLKMEKKKNWQCYILFFEIVIFYLVGLLPLTIPNMVANAFISFASALQFCSFRTLVDGPYATVFCTGNIRSSVELFYKGFVQKDKVAFLSARRYSYIILFFLFGGTIAAVLSNYLLGKTIWVCCLFLIIPLVYIYRANRNLLLEEI
jgi:uncharacterized membrane protein YoaK (UPF0700 family)